MMDQATKQLVLQRIAEGGSVRTVSDELGPSTQAIYKMLRKLGVEIPNMRRRKMPDDVREVASTVARLGSVAAAAKHYGCTRQAVYQRLSASS